MMIRIIPQKVSFSLLLVLCVVALTHCHASNEERKVYIVYMGGINERDQSPSSTHFNMLQNVVDPSHVERSLVRSYTRSFNGFAASLTEQEKDQLAGHEDVVTIIPSTTYYPQTTRSWDYMGVSEHVHRDLTVESDIVIGVLDSGVWPESESFSDVGFGPPPKKWKGACKGGFNFTCNHKLIGARYYNSLEPGYVTARDEQGHGTHTASTAAGNYVRDVSYHGLAKGTVRGGVPSARIAAYKVCYVIGCSSPDILAAFDDAIADGVDIINLSLGGGASDLTLDVNAIGALHAAQKGILVVQAAGNSGQKGTTGGTVPWILTAAASIDNRGIATKVALGDGTTLTGKSVNTFDLKGTMYPLVYGKDVTMLCSEEAAKACTSGCLQEHLVKGKIVLCNTYQMIDEVSRAGAVGLVVQADSQPDVSFTFPLPTSAISEKDFSVVESYVNSTKFPKVTILKSEAIRIHDAPRMASFSSRGPNLIIPDILKPDITAPGMDILAAYSPLAPPSDSSYDKTSTKYNILSGTSMSCPHIAGSAAYIKSLNPDWSPSAIKSALMTTSWRMNAKEDPYAEFSYGAGHIDPVKAADPGLVYETLWEDYGKMLCALGYNTTTIVHVFGLNSHSCSNGVMKPRNLNYPSMTAQVEAAMGNRSTPFSAKFIRTVTNVGHANSTYKVTTSKSSEYSISVKPRVLKFKALHEKKSFEVTISGKMKGNMSSAELEWSDGSHHVRSPIVVYTDSF